MHKIYILMGVLLVLAFVIRDANPNFVQDFRTSLKQYIGDYETVDNVYKNYHNKNRKPYGTPTPVGGSNAKITI